MPNPASVTTRLSSELDKSRINHEAVNDAFALIWSAAKLGQHIGAARLMKGYIALLRAVGRDIDPAVAPRRMWNGAPLTAFSDVRDEGMRFRMVYEAVGEIMGYLTFAPHWTLADATFKGWALAEVPAMARAQDQAMQEAYLANADGRAAEAEQCLRCAEISAEQGERYQQLAEGKGWAR